MVQPVISSIRKSVSFGGDAQKGRVSFLKGFHTIRFPCL